jgi:hypothetical protein
VNLPFVFVLVKLGLVFVSFWNSDRLGDFPLTW